MKSIINYKEYFTAKTLKLVVNSNKRKFKNFFSHSLSLKINFKCKIVRYFTADVNVLNGTIAGRLRFDHRLVSR